MDIVIESVPNISEGRNIHLINLIVKTIELSKVNLLDFHYDWDHNRSVFSFIGSIERVFDCIFNITEVIYDKVDLDKHVGVHPRSGAIDVIPFIPIKNISYKDLVNLVDEFGYKFFEKFNIPVYFYGFNSRSKDRFKMNRIRNLGFEKLKEILDKADPSLKPDIYKNNPIHERLGVSFIGVRKTLLAFNINYKNDSKDLKEKLTNIAKKIRESSNGIKNVQAKVFYLESRNLYQLSLNVLDILNTDFYFIFEKIKQYTVNYNLRIENTEIIGLIPTKTIEKILNNYLLNSNFNLKKVIEIEDQNI